MLTIIWKECEILDYNATLRGRCGMQTLELDVLDTQNNRHIVIMQDMGGRIMKTDVTVGIVKNREERNREIKRLYDEYHLSQTFLARFFKLAQSSISMIVHAEELQAEEVR